MGPKEHRPGVSAVNLVVRHLKLDVDETSELAAALQEIDQMHGLDDVSFDDKSRILNLAYDATHTSIDGIEALLEKHGIGIGHDWWTHFKEGYYRFVDQNVKDNAKHQPHCCSKPPVIPAKR